MSSGEIKQTHSISQREQIKYRLLYWLNAYPHIFMPVARLRYRHLDDLLVSPQTDLVIEAFGRAGSTFANFAFLSAQTRPVRTVHHTHAAAQVITAVKLRVPTLVMVRPPVDSALSHMARHNISAKPALVAWVRFHQRILPYRDGIVFASFDQVTKEDFGAVIRRINTKFRTKFDIWEHTPENEERVFERIRQRNRQRFSDESTPARWRALAIPTTDREALKQELRSQIMVDALEPLRNRAERLYSSILQLTRPRAPVDAELAVSNR